MGISGIGPGSLLLILGIVLLVFGTKRLRNLGSDAGSAIKGFKKAMNDEDAQDAKLTQDESAPVADHVQVKEEKEEKLNEGDEQLMSMIKVGKPAPEFTASAYIKGKYAEVSLSEYKGKWVLLCFYPGDFTFV